MIQSVGISMLLVLGACPPVQKASTDASTTACSTVGQSCEVAPGKLGTCVRRDDCTTEPCMVCQSQH